MGKCENDIIADGAHWEIGKIRAPDGIWTHDPPWSTESQLKLWSNFHLTFGPKDHKDGVTFLSSSSTAGQKVNSKTVPEMKFTERLVHAR